MMNRNFVGPVAIARIRGSGHYPQIRGNITFQQRKRGVLVTVELFGLPGDSEGSCSIHALHIHDGSSCTGNVEDPFADAKGHYNPENREHPCHAGDLPPLFGNHGYAYMSVFTDRFTVDEIIGRVVIVHRNLDDFTTQPAGNAGEKIACGKIQLLRR